jgi:hypothetical protein
VSSTTDQATPPTRPAPPAPDLLDAGQQEHRELRRAFALAASMTLLMTLLRTPPSSSVFLTLLLIAGLLAPRYLRRSPWFWALLFVMFMISPILRPWLALDNHHFLHVYWLAAIALTRFASRPDEALQTVARLLIGLAFAFAVAWKLMVPEFIDGSFFEYTFGTDSRLADVAVAVGLHEDGFHRDNRGVISSWQEPGTPPASGEMVIHDSIGPLSVVLAWLTIVIEGSVAVAFLAPLRGRWRYLRDAALLVFVASTYPLAPVLGFAWLLICMGAMASHLRTAWRYGLYVAAFAAVALLEERAAMLAWVQTSGLGDVLRSVGSVFF